MGCGAGGSCTPRPPIRQQQAPETRVVAVVFLGLLLDLLAFTLLLPLLPGLLESHGRAHFLSAPLTGALSDCLGRRPGMLLSLAGVATSYAVWAASKSFAAFLASRVIGGISKGNVSLCTAIVADLGSPSARSKGMAVIGVAFSLGFTLGPTLGAFLPSETVPWLALLFAVSDLLFIWCFLPETLPPEKRAPSVTLGLVYFLYLFLFSGLEFTLSFLVHQRFRFSRVEQGKMFFFIGLTLARAVGPVVAASAYWLAGARVCYTVCAALFLLPFSILRTLSPPARTLKAE